MAKSVLKKFFTVNSVPEVAHACEEIELYIQEEIEFLSSNKALLVF